MTESSNSDLTSTKLQWIVQMARKDRAFRFTNLAHLLTIEHLREALDEPDYPQIVYRLESYALATGNTAEAEAEGTMTIHGTTRSILLDIEIDESETPARALGQTSIDMSEFGVTPPAVWGGLLKVGAVVSIKFEMALPGGE